MASDLTPPMPSEPTRQDRKAEKGRVKAQRRNRRKLSKQRGMSKMRRDPKGKRKMGKKR
ncbi:MAG: hypothetical protein H0V33_01785 [Acidimicrobiia bacterium]|nr:hypothetical protein [Acidimicrobiia bacterium]